MEQEKKKAGRPRKTFTKKQLQEAERLAGLGFSEEALCKSVFGCSVSTLQRRKKEGKDANSNFEDIEQYIERGKLKSIEAVSASLFDLATGKNGNTPNIQACIFYLKNKGKNAGNAWTDTSETVHNVDLSKILTQAQERTNIHTIEGEKITRPLPYVQTDGRTDVEESSSTSFERTDVEKK